MLARATAAGYLVDVNGLAAQSIPSSCYHHSPCAHCERRKGRTHPQLVNNPPRLNQGETTRTTDGKEGEKGKATQVRYGNGRRDCKNNTASTLLENRDKPLEKGRSSTKASWLLGAVLFNYWHLSFLPYIILTTCVLLLTYWFVLATP